MTEQELYINHRREAYGSQRTHLRLDVTQGLLNLPEPQESTLRK